MAAVLPYYAKIPGDICCNYSIRSFCNLKVNGRGSVMARPDTAETVLGVVTEDMQLSVAQQENSRITSAVIQAIMQTGIPAEDIQTNAYNIEAMYDYIDGRQVFRGYRVTHNLKVTIKNVAMVGRVIDNAVNAGANTVNGISFSVSDPSVYYKVALNAALDDAISKAAEIAMKLKVAISRVPVQIIEESYQTIPPVQPFQMQTAMPSTPVQPGRIEVAAQITAVFQYGSA